MRLADLDGQPPTLTTGQAAELLGVARGTLWAAARDGDAPVGSSIPQLVYRNSVMRTESAAPPQGTSGLCSIDPSRSPH